MKTSYKLFLLGFSSAFIGSVGVAHAQSEGVEAGSDTLDEIVVTAQRRGESIQSVPIAIQAFSSDAIQEKGLRGIQDFAQYIPNVSIISPTGAGGPPNVTIRGVGLNDFNSNNAGPNGFYVDEVYISAPSAQGISLFDLERVEVLKGPQGTLYGRNSSGGAINIITAKPTQTLAGRLHTEYSSFDTRNFEGYLSGPLSETLSARVSGVYNYSKGYAFNRLTGTQEDGANNGALRGQLLWEPSSDLTVLAKSQYYRSVARPVRPRSYGTLDPVTGAQCSVADVYAARCVDLFGYSSGTNPYRGDWNRMGKGGLTNVDSSLRVDYNLGDDLSFVSLSSYNNNSRTDPEESDGGPKRLVELNFGVDSDTFTQEFRLASNREGFNWVTGAYYLTEVLKQDQTGGALLDFDTVFGRGAGDGIAFRLFTHNKQKTDAYAVFGQSDYELLPDLTLTTGARYTWERRSFDSVIYQTLQKGGMDRFGPPQDLTDTTKRLTSEKFNWRLGLNYKLNQEVMLYSSAATGFKSGGFNGGFLDQDPAKRLKQLQPFKPETVKAYEAGVKSSLFGRKVTLNLTAFYNDYRGQQLQVMVPNSNPPVLLLDNAEKSRIYGVEGELTVKPISNVTLAAQAGYLNTKVLDFAANQTGADYSGNHLALAPSFTTSLSADWDIPVSNGVVGLHWDSNYRSKQYNTVANSPYATIGSYWLHNARVSYNIDDRWQVAAFARNLTDRKYNVWPSELINPFGLVVAVTGVPRSFGLELSMNF